jgi:hypothetical protein
MISTNKIKTTWEIANLKTCRKAKNTAIESFNIDSRIINNQQHIGNTFSSYILLLADNINIKIIMLVHKYNPNTAIIIVPYNLFQIHKSTNKKGNTNTNI